MQIAIMDNTRIDLEEFISKKIEGVMFRVKANWTEYGEMNSKFYFGLEKSRSGAKSCSCLINDKGMEIKDPKEILLHQRHFYEQLYKEDEDVEFMLENTSDVLVPEELIEQGEAPFTIQEMAIAIKNLANGKTPGADGLPIDWYKVFFAKIKDILFAAIQEAFHTGRLYTSALQGIINLIPKQAKDSRYLKNNRPITILNSCYKVIEKMIANRLQPMLEKIVNMDQKGFMKNRKIASNIRRILDQMMYAKENDLEAIILSLDFQKCFDNVSFTAITGTMEYFKFPRYLTKWTQVPHNGFNAKIQNAGNFSKDTNILKGVHQGGPCSAYYFLICAEILAMNLRNNEKIKGIPVNMIRNLLGQYADDMDIYLIKDRQSYKEVLLELSKFKRHSGFA